MELRNSANRLTFKIKTSLQPADPHPLRLDHATFPHLGLSIPLRARLPRHSPPPRAHAIPLRPFRS